MSDAIKKFTDLEADLENELENFAEEPEISSPDEEFEDDGENEKVSGWSYFTDLVFNVIIIFGLAWFIRMMIVSPFYVDGQSMVPTLEHNDFLIVDKLSYHFRDPQRGEVVIVRPPDHPDIFYVKRVIGLPGETIEFVDGKIRIKNDEHSAGFLLPEDYLNTENLGHTYLPSHQNQRFYIPEKRYFLIGDNRNHSSDSRAWQQLHPENGGTVPRKMIVGRAAARFWIPEKIFWKLGLPHFQIVSGSDYELSQK